MSSCSRISRRCGEIDASRSGGAGGTLTPSCERARSLPTATCEPTPGSNGVVGVLSSCPRPRTARPGRGSRTRSRAGPSTHSLCPIWNSVVPSSSQSIRLQAALGALQRLADLVVVRRSTALPGSRCAGRRARRPVAAAARPPGSTCRDRTRSTRRTPTPRGRTTRREDRSSSAFASTSSSPSPNCSSMRRAVSSCAGVMSTPTTRAAPCRFSHAPKYAVPQPSSTTSLPSRSGSIRTSDSGTLHIPQAISSRAHATGARSSVYSAFDFVQTRGSSRGSQSNQSADLARCRLRRVGAVHEIVRHREREVAADRARSRSRPGSWRPSSSARPRSRPRPRARARASAPR